MPRKPVPTRAPEPVKPPPPPDTRWKHNLERGEILGEEIWPHCDLTLDPIAAKVLGLPLRGKASPVPDGPVDTAQYVHTIKALIEIACYQEKRILELEDGNRAAQDDLSMAYESDSIDDRADYARRASRTLERCL